MQTNKFLDLRFPTDISIDSSGGPEFFTTINTNRFKGEFRNINWEQPRRRYNVGYNLKSKKQMDQLLAFFNLCKGRGTSFRYKDWIDHEATDITLGLGDGSTATFQLIKTYTVDNHKSTRTITKPLESTVKVFVNGNAVPAGDFTIGRNTGLVQLSTPPQNGQTISATFEFDTPVRFENDFLSIKQSGKSNYSAQDLVLIETLD